MNRSIMTAAALAAALSAPMVGRAQEPSTTTGVKPLNDGQLGNVFTLSQFGKVGTPAEAQAAFDAAAKSILASGGGTLFLPAETAPNWVCKNIVQEEVRIPDPPASATNWRHGPPLTVIDLRKGAATVQPSQTTGMRFQRTLALPFGQSLPHWDYQPMIKLDNTIVRGSNSYRDWLQEDAKAGKDARLYVRTVRGLFPGEFLNSGDYGKVERLYVKALGYDKEKQCWYFTADLGQDIHKGAMIHNKNHANIMRMDTYSHNENQTFDVMVWRHNYSQGDNYLFDARMSYMGDAHSCAGDENNILYAAFINAEDGPFNAKVASFDAATGSLVFTGGENANTLGTGRPLINFNPKKWITAGKVHIVRPASSIDDSGADLGDPVWKGQKYPTTVGKDQLNMTVLKVGGLIRFTADAPITRDVVGRYFAIDEPDETLPRSKTRRWYLIDSVTINPDGTKDIKIIRHWWGAKAAGSPTLYNPDNYTQDGHEKPLKYIIAPGVNVYDVADGVESVGYPATGKKTLRLAPTPFSGTEFDFAKDDPVEQAVGPDPFHPISFRSWIWEKVPSPFPAAVFDIANQGEIQRHTVLNVAGGGNSLEAAAKKRYDHQTAWDTYIAFQSTAKIGIDFNGDVHDAAILFRQTNNRAQPIVWKHASGSATLTVSPSDGSMKLDAPSVAVPGGVTQATGLSATPKRANNLRGIAVAVKAGMTKVEVKFAKAESDAEYAVFIETSWLSNRAVTQQTAEGFVVEFDKAPAADARLHWMIVR